MDTQKAVSHQMCSMNKTSKVRQKILTTNILDYLVKFRLLTKTKHKKKNTNTQNKSNVNYRDLHRFEGIASAATDTDGYPAFVRKFSSTISVTAAPFTNSVNASALVSGAITI